MRLPWQIDEAFTEIQFYKAAEKIYQMLDTTYSNGLIQLEQAIFQVFERTNELYATPTGELLDKYEKLSGLQLDELFNGIAEANSIDSLVAERLFGPRRGEIFLSEDRQRKPLVNRAVEILKEIKGKIERQQKVLAVTKPAATGQVNIWEHISPEMKGAIQDFWKESRIKRSEGKRLLIEKFCRERNIDKDTFRSEKDRVEKRKSRPGWADQ